MSAMLDLSTRRIKIYASAFDALARADLDAHEANLANPHGVTKAQVGLGLADNTSDAGKPVSTAQAAALALRAPLASPALTGIPSAPTAAPGTATTQLATTAFALAAANDVAADLGTVDADLAAHVANTANPHGVTKAQVGLSLVDNTADLAKPVSGPQQTAINAVAADVTAVEGDLAAHAGNVSNPHAVTKAQVGLGSVDNTADLSKPVSSAQQTAINVAANAAGVAQDDIDAHQANTSNPHGVTKAQVGLAVVDNTSDANKPVSAAQQTAINAVATKANDAQLDIDQHQLAINNPHSVTKTHVGLANVDNTSDANKPVSTAQQAAINVAGNAAGAAQADIDGHQANLANPHAVTKTQVGLGSVDNTADLDKPVSNPQQIALNLKAPLLSPALTGTPTAPTAAPGTNTPQLATTAFTAAGLSIVQSAANAAQADADAAQADATQALADAAAAQAAADAAQAALGVPYRPGDAVALYGETKTGPPDAVMTIDPAWIAVSPAGSVVRVVSATADDPQTIAPAAAFPVEPGRVYEVRWRTQRILNPADPLNDAVTIGIQWLTNAKAANGATVIENIPLVQADGVVERIARIGITPSAAADLDYVAPANSIYFRPYFDIYGDATAQTDAVTIEVEDITAIATAVAAATHIAVNVVTPASGAIVTLGDFRPLFVNTAALALLTIKLPPGAVSGDLVELGFLAEVTSLLVQTDVGGAIATAPSSAYGPGSAIQMRYISNLVGWVLWK